MIPPFAPDGKLPPGIHRAAWMDVVERFGINPHRRRLLVGLGRAIEALQDAGCTAIYVDGSFTTNRLKPNDFDACWDATGVNFDRLDDALTGYGGDRNIQRQAYGEDLFPAQGLADPIGTTFLEFFQMDKFTRRRKGIVAIRLGGTA